GVYYTIELAQGDDLQARLPVGGIGMNLIDPQWRDVTIEMPYATHFVPFIQFTNITSSLDIDDLAISLSSSSKPIPPITTILDCHYIWLNNSDSLQPGGAGYLSTRLFRITVSDPVYCLSFQYYRFGLTFRTSKLTVLAFDEQNQKSIAQIWPINSINYTYINQRWSWAYAPLLIGSYSLLFRMDSDYEVDSSFALDSISVNSCGYLQKYFYGT
ncbi:unnamed protein product, partial [Rotaria socialis]